MIQRFVRDESGVTLAVSVFMVVLIGVMGAGLLTFVMSDSGSVLEVNKGQRAMDIAEAGVQVAKAHLRADSWRQHYDTDYTNDCNALTSGPRTGVEDWSKSTTTWPTANCTGTPTIRAASAVGVTKNFNGGKFTVTIECFRQYNDPTGSDDPCVNGAGNAPDYSATGAAGTRKFFKITSTGYDTTAGTGAKRKIEAVYTSSIKTYAPIAFWTPANINFNGSTTVKKMSFFAGGNILNIANVTPDTSADALYGDWNQPPYNTTPRRKSDGTPFTTPGFGAVGRVCRATTCTSDSDSIADGYRDYDSTTGSKGQNKQFVRNYNTPSTQITFPFEEGNALNNPREIVDPGQLDEIRAAAQGSAGTTSHCYSIAPRAGYCSVDANTTTDIGRIQGGAFTITSWPSQGATVFVEGTQANPLNVEFKINSPGSTPLPRGILVVKDGNFNFSNAFSRNGFNGVILVVGNGTTTGQYTQGGNVQLDGYAASSGEMKLSGAVEPSTTIDYLNLNSFYDLKLWSWRELYQ